jgi:hypothetical protein
MHLEMTESDTIELCSSRQISRVVAGCTSSWGYLFDRKFKEVYRKFEEVGRKWLKVNSK